MNDLKAIEELAARNTRRAWEVIRDLDVENVWKTLPAEVNLVGSLKMGLLMKHRDIDFHVYSEGLDLAESFAAMARLAAHPSVTRVEGRNLTATEEEYVGWHAWYHDVDGEEWQVDMIHLRRGSAFDGWVEETAERIRAVLTEETRRTILALKYQTPDSEKIMGLDYCRAVLADGVREFSEFREWLKHRSNEGLISWRP